MIRSYCWFIVYSYYNELKEERTHAAAVAALENNKKKTSELPLLFDPAEIDQLVYKRGEHIV